LPDCEHCVGCGQPNANKSIATKKLALNMAKSRYG